jgi:hypothetical protein
LADIVMYLLSSVSTLNFFRPMVRNDVSKFLLLHNYFTKYILLTSSIFLLKKLQKGARGDVVVKALRYKPAGRGFDSQCFHCNFSVT